MCPDSSRTASSTYDMAFFCRSRRLSTSPPRKIGPGARAMRSALNRAPFWRYRQLSLLGGFAIDGAPLLNHRRLARYRQWRKKVSDDHASGELRLVDSRARVDRRL